MSGTLTSSSTTAYGFGRIRCTIASGSVSPFGLVAKRLLTNFGIDDCNVGYGRHRRRRSAAARSASGRPAAGDNIRRRTAAEGRGLDAGLARALPRDFGGKQTSFRNFRRRVGLFTRLCSRRGPDCEVEGAMTRYLDLTVVDFTEGFQVTLSELDRL